MKRNDILIISSFFIFLFLFLGLSGTITSGYHFVDDHEIIRIENELESSSLIQVTKKWIKDDLRMRFRPVYIIHRILETKLFGSNWLIWKIYTGLLAVICWSCFYAGMRKLNLPEWESVLFVLISFMGPQMAIWWRLGPNETIGLVFLAIGFLFMTNCTYKYYYFNSALFYFTIILSALSKESLLMTVPAFLILKIWNEKVLFNISIKQVVKKNYLILIPIVITIVCCFIIITMVGINVDSMSQVRIDDRIWSLLNKMYLIIKNSFIDYLSLILTLIILSLLFIREQIALKNYWRDLIFPFFFSLLVLIPNIVLYSNSGIWERYYLPATLGLAFLIAFIVFKIETKYLWLRKLIIIAVFVFSISPLDDSFRNALEFAKDGRFTNSLLSSVEDNIDEKTQLLIVVDPVQYYEQSVSLKYYLTINGVKNIYGHPLIKNYEDPFLQKLALGWLSYFEGKQMDQLTEPPGIIVFLDKAINESFFIQSHINPYDYINVLESSSPFALFVKQ